MIRVAAVGTASTGKSALLNAVFGTAFPVDARADSTVITTSATVDLGIHQLEILDIPPHQSADADVYLLVCDKDLTRAEHGEAQRIVSAGRAIGVILNKSDTYDPSQLARLLEIVRQRLQPFIPPDRVVACEADPVRVVYRDGEEEHLSAPADVSAVIPLIEELVAEAAASVRVQARELTLRAAKSTKAAADKLSGFFKQHLG